MKNRASSRRSPGMIALGFAAHDRLRPTLDETIDRMLWISLHTGLELELMLFGTFQNENVRGRVLSIDDLGVVEFACDGDAEGQANVEYIDRRDILQAYAP